MKFIKYYVYIVTFLCTIGVIALVDEGDLDIYTILVYLSMVLSSYYIYKNEDKNK